MISTSNLTPSGPFFGGALSALRAFSRTPRRLSLLIIYALEKVVKYFSTKTLNFFPSVFLVRFLYVFRPKSLFFCRFADFCDYSVSPYFLRRPFSVANMTTTKTATIATISIPKLIHTSVGRIFIISSSHGLKTQLVFPGNAIW